MALPPALAKLADAFSDYLFETECFRRISHHMAHVASENWLAAEFAYLFNTRAHEFGAGGWSALLERKRVDLTLVPPTARPEGDLPACRVYLELKLVDTGYWRTAWSGVRKDLTGLGDDGKGRSKPTATYAICFLSNSLSSPPHRQLEATREKYRQYMARVPPKGGWFRPVPKGARLYLEHTSAAYRLKWKAPVVGRWPNGYEADVRVLWVRR